MWENLEFNARPGNTFILVNSVFQDSHFNMSFTKKIINIFVIYYINNIQTVIQGQIDLEVHCFYLEITWKILEFHGTGEVGTLYLLFYFLKPFMMCFSGEIWP